MHIGYFPEHVWSLVSSRPKEQQIMVGAVRRNAYNFEIKRLTRTCVDVSRSLLIPTCCGHLGVRVTPASTHKSARRSRLFCADTLLSVDYYNVVYVQTEYIHLFG
eukprot:COSAG04_NODE_18410_length_442_cov_1.338192_1_plen_104_part_01